MLALNLHSKEISSKSFHYFKLFICPPDEKILKYSSGLTTPPPPPPLQVLYHVPVEEITALQKAHLHFIIFITFNLCSKRNISKTASINACIKFYYFLLQF